MVLKNTFIEGPGAAASATGQGGRKRGRAAFTVLELMVASALGLLACLAIMMLTIFSSRSFIAIANYVHMDERSQLALDKMSREIRQTRRLIEFTPTTMTFQDADDKQLQFLFDQKARQLVRVQGGVTNIYLSDCDALEFSNFQRTPISNSFDAYETAYVTNTKLVQVSWTCSRKILGAKMNTESVQSSKICIRNH
jgi:Tfp pilus assembly protein PilW